jgi:hypothetical protein
MLVPKFKQHTPESAPLQQPWSIFHCGPLTAIALMILPYEFSECSSLSLLSALLLLLKLCLQLDCLVVCDEIINVAQLFALSQQSESYWYEDFDYLDISYPSHGSSHSEEAVTSYVMAAQRFSILN